MRTRARAAMVAATTLLLSLLVPAGVAVAVPVGARTTATALLNELVLAYPSATPYDRSQFAEGLDLDGDGCETRQELLEEEGVGAHGEGCTTFGGTWTSYYDGQVITDPSALDMDHLVALAEAWRSGAHAWTPQQRNLFANDLEIPESLTLVSASANRSKGDRDPSQWMPPLPSAHCRYVTEWVTVKWRWNLSVDPVEKQAIEKTLAGCGNATITAPAHPSIGRPGQPPLWEPPAGESVWRFYSPGVRGHFYTMSPTERDRLISDSPDGWRYEGQGFTAYRTQIEGTIPLFRFYAPAQKAHFFTTSVTERDRLRNTNSGWRYEGVAFYVWPDTDRAGTVEMARFWNFKSRRHFYTASPTERDRVLASLGDTWRYEGSNFAVPAGGVGAKIPPPYPGDSKNCGDFRDYGHAKAWFDLHYPHYGDVARLDNNRDMIPCETLPGAP